MKTSLKSLSILGITLLLVSCSNKGENVANKNQDSQRPAITEEQKELSGKMIAASKDLSKSQVIGNTTFKSYDKLVVKYGKDSKNLSLTKEFSGKDGFVVLDNLAPSTTYAYEIFDGTNRISVGTVKTQK